MGIMQNKVTRRVALGSIAAGLGGTALVLHSLKGRYAVKIPDKAVTIGPRKLDTMYGGKKITLDIPRMEIKTPEDKKKLESILMEQLKKKPEYVEVNKMNIEKWKDDEKKSGLDSLDAIEKRTLDKIAKSSTLSEKEKQNLTKQVKEATQTNKAKIASTIDGLKTPSSF